MLTQAKFDLNVDLPFARVKTEYSKSLLMIYFILYFSFNFVDIVRNAYGNMYLFAAFLVVSGLAWYPKTSWYLQKYGKLNMLIIALPLFFCFLVFGHKPVVLGTLYCASDYDEYIGTARILFNTKWYLRADKSVERMTAEINRLKSLLSEAATEGAKSYALSFLFSLFNTITRPSAYSVATQTVNPAPVASVGTQTVNLNPVAPVLSTVDTSVVDIPPHTFELTVYHLPSFSASGDASVDVGDAAPNFTKVERVDGASNGPNGTDIASGLDADTSSSVTGRTSSGSAAAKDKDSSSEVVEKVDGAPASGEANIATGKVSESAANATPVDNNQAESSTSGSAGRVAEAENNADQSVDDDQANNVAPQELDDLADQFGSLGLVDSYDDINLEQDSVNNEEEMDMEQLSEAEGEIKSSNEEMDPKVEDNSDAGEADDLDMSDNADSVASADPNELLHDEEMEHASASEVSSGDNSIHDEDTGIVDTGVEVGGTFGASDEESLADAGSIVDTDEEIDDARSTSTTVESNDEASADTDTQMIDTDNTVTRGNNNHVSDLSLDSGDCNFVAGDKSRPIINNVMTCDYSSSLTIGDGNNSTVFDAAATSGESFGIVASTGQDTAMIESGSQEEQSEVDEFINFDAEDDTAQEVCIVEKEDNSHSSVVDSSDEVSMSGSPEHLMNNVADALPPAHVGIINDVCGGLNPSDPIAGGDENFGVTAPILAGGNLVPREEVGGSNNSDLLLGHSAAAPTAGGNFLSEPLGGSVYGQGFQSMASAPPTFGSFGMDNTWNPTASSVTMNPSIGSNSTLASPLNACSSSGNDIAASSIVAPPTTALDSYYAQLRARAFSRHMPSISSSSGAVRAPPVSSSGDDPNASITSSSRQLEVELDQDHHHLFSEYDGEQDNEEQEEVQDPQQAAVDAARAAATARAAYYYTRTTLDYSSDDDDDNDWDPYAETDDEEADTPNAATASTGAPNNFLLGEEMVPGAAPLSIRREESESEDDEPRRSTPAELAAGPIAQPRLRRVDGGGAGRGSNVGGASSSSVQPQQQRVIAHPRSRLGARHVDASASFGPSQQQ